MKRSLLLLTVIMAVFISPVQAADEPTVYTYFSDLPGPTTRCTEAVQNTPVELRIHLCISGQDAGGYYSYYRLFVHGCELAENNCSDAQSHSWRYRPDQCTLPEVINTSTGVCEVPGSECTAGLKGIFATATSTNLISVNGCEYKKSAGVSACIGTGEGSCIGNYESTGELESVSNPGTAAGNSGCIINSEGKQTCLSENKLNCGTLNGKQYCQDEMPLVGNDCTLLPGGSIICNGTNTPNTTLPNGQPIPTEGTVTGTTIDPVTGEVTNNTSTIYGLSSGDGNSGTSEITGEVGIDETGIPSDASGTMGNTGDSEYNSFKDGISNPDIAPTINTNFIPDLPNYSTCQSITTTVSGRTFTFPSESQCIKLEYFKDILAWFMYILTAYFLFDTVLSARSRY